MNKDSCTKMVLDGRDLIQILQSVPEGKRPLLSAIAGAYMDDGPALFFRKAVTGFPLHGDVGLAFVVIIHLLVGGHPIKAINTVFHAPFIYRS